MTLVIRDPETDRLAREVAALHGIEPSEAVRVALEGELRRHGAARSEVAQSSLAERMGPVWERIEALGDRRRGRPADKAFHDDLSGS